MKRFTKAALGGLAGFGLILGATQSAGSVEGETTYTFAGPLRDLQTTTDGAFDSARAQVKITETAGGTTYWLRVKGIDPTAAGDEFGAHLHVGSCVEGDPAATGGHYNIGGAASPETEVWFELKPNENGVAADTTSVPFVPTDFHGDQVMSIVIHVDSTDETTGLAGLKQACLPLDFSEDQQ